MELQNRLETSRTCRQYLKQKKNTEKQNESHWKSPDLAKEDRTGWPLQKQQQHTQTMTTDHRSNNTIIKGPDFFFQGLLQLC
jgi:hypothetical protein